MKAFKIKVDGKLLDYRLGHKVDLNAFSSHLQTKGYNVEKLWHEKRHAVGIIKKGNKKYFVKLSTSKGMNIPTQNEYKWNAGINKNKKPKQSNFIFPKNFDSGYYNKLYYLIINYQEGRKLAEKPNPGYEHSDFASYLSDIIDIAEFIQNSEISNLNPDGDISYENYQERFIAKTNSWYKEISTEVREKYKVKELLDIVEKDTKNLDGKLRHGDFTPWHIFIANEYNIFLFDGERADSKYVENYDICFFIQRVYSVLENKDLASMLLSELKMRQYNFRTLRPVLASRAIGGFLDRSLHAKPDYSLDLKFKNLVLDLKN